MKFKEEIIMDENKQLIEVKIYYAEKLPFTGLEERDGKTVEYEIDDKNISYSLVWQGSSALLDLEFTDDSDLLESVYDYFNEDTEPENFVGKFRSFSAGDVVCLQDRCYFCKNFGWRKIDGFVPNS